MENILQSIVRIIIIGCMYTTVNGNRQFLPAPLPYYQNENFYLPSYVPPYQEPAPVYYRAQNPPPVVPISPEFRNPPPISPISTEFQNPPSISPEFRNSPPISYQNVNSLSSPQLFRQNDNYNPANFPNPVRYPVPPIFQYKPNTYQGYKPLQKNFPQSTFKKTSVVQATISSDANQKKPGFYQTNIIVKDETHPPFYEEDYNKNYHDDDYTDNYSDENPSVPEPCLSSTPYRYFESRKGSSVGKLPLCNPHFQPNFGNSVYTVRMPITLLPSRFPPRVEQLIERIQNYFSTYTQQQNGKPQNETSQSSTAQPATAQSATAQPTSAQSATIQPVTEVTSESAAHPTVVSTSEDNKRNKTTEILELSLEEAHPEPTEVPTVPQVSQQVPQKTIVVEVEAQDKDTEENKEMQVVAQIVPNPTTGNSAAVEIPAVTTPKPNFVVSQESAPSDKSSENQIPKEWDQKTVIPGVQTPQGVASSTESPATEKGSTEEVTFILPTTDANLLGVSDTNG